MVDRWPTTLISYRACPVSSSGQKTEYTSSYNLSSEQLTDRVDMLAVRLAPIRQKDNLLPEEGSKMETTTTNRVCTIYSTIAHVYPITILPLVFCSNGAVLQQCKTSMILWTNTTVICSHFIVIYMRLLYF